MRGDTAAVGARALARIFVVTIATFTSGHAAVSAQASVVSRSAPGVIAYGYPYAAQCPAAGIAEKVDRWGMYMCNCTSYVAWALTVNRQRINWFIPGAMDANNWAHVARLVKLRVGTTPRVGAVAVWPRETRFGHVAYVTRVDPDGSFDVSEYNLPDEEWFHPFAFDVRHGIVRAGAVFVYVPRRLG
jgi:surface antigen